MRHRILYTHHDGRVIVTCPSVWAIQTMAEGGFWHDLPRGFGEIQIERQMARGIPESVAARYVRAMMLGGCTQAEALAIIRDRDCAPHGTACELLDVSDICRDRWFRNAWQRSPNGGPVYIDMRKARALQLTRLREAAAGARYELRWGIWRERIRKAQTPEWLKAVWPRGLSWEGVRP